MKTIYLFGILFLVCFNHYAQNNESFIQQQVVVNPSNFQENVFSNNINTNLNIKQNLITNKSNNTNNNPEKLVFRSRQTKNERSQHSQNNNIAAPRSNNHLALVQETPVNKTNEDESQPLKKNNESLPIQNELDINLNLNLPSIKKEEQKMIVTTPKVQEKSSSTYQSSKRLEDFRIKTGNSNASSVSKTKIHNNNRGHFVKKKVILPLKCWWNKNFNSGIKFKFSCTCFYF